MTRTIPDEEVLSRFPGIPIDYDNVFHYRGLLQQKLLFNRCKACGHWLYPHRPVCPECWSEEIAPAEVSGKGSVYFYTIVHQGPPIPGMDFPFVVAGVEFEEQRGFRYLATIAGCRNEDVKTGMAVELSWIERSGSPAPAFRPAR